MVFNFVKFAAGALVAVSIVAAATPAFAVQPPPGLRTFCAGNPSHCVGGGAPVMTATPDLMALLRSVNSRVNRSIRFENERGDVWALNPRSGDCEDFVISKRAALIEHGVSPSSLRIGMTYTRRGEPHAVLIVKTDAGDMVLDNLAQSVRTLQETRYRIIAMSTKDPKRWQAGS